LINPAQHSVYLATIHGSGGAKSINSHSYTMKATNQPLASELPRSINDLETIKVTLSSSLTPLEKAAVSRTYDARPKRIIKQTEWYKEHNVRYERFKMDSTLNVDDPNIKLPLYETDADFCITEPRQSDPSKFPFFFILIVESTPNLRQVSENIHIVERKAYLMDHDQRVNVEDVVKDKIDKVVAQKSGEFYSDYEKTYIVDAFPELFPYGRGSLDEMTDHSWSLESFIRHVLQLSHQSFSRHYSFMLIMFDILSRHRGANGLYLRTTRSPDIALSALKCTKENLEIQLNYRKQLLLSLRANKPPPQKPEFDQDVFNLQCGVKSGQAAMWGTSDERMCARTKAFSMQAKLGAVNIFLTMV
jgi:hypothetical protein